MGRTFGVMYDHTFSKLANHQIRHQATPEIYLLVNEFLATHKVDCQPGDCIRSL